MVLGKLVEAARRFIDDGEAAVLCVGFHYIVAKSVETDDSLVFGVDLNGLPFACDGGALVAVRRHSTMDATLVLPDCLPQHAYEDHQEI